MKNTIKNFTVVSLEQIQRGVWTFKVSGNDYEDGILIIASHGVYGYTTLKYFQNSGAGRKWINSLVALDSEQLASEVEKQKSTDLKNI